MRVFLSLTISAVALGLMLAGCTGDQATLSAGSTGGGGVTGTSSSATGAGGSDLDAFIDDLCNVTGQLLCEAHFTCCGDANQLGLGATVDECSANAAGKYCTWRGTPKKGLASGDITFDKAQMDTCIAEFKAMLAGGAACRDAIVHYDTVCAGAFQGKLLPGEPCTAPDNDLESFWQCRGGRCMQGKCAPFLKLGDPCIVPHSTINMTTPETLCNYVTEEWCFGPTFKGPGVCGPQGDIGAACDQTVQDPFYECKSYTCDPMLGQCVEPFTGWLCSRF